MILTHLKKLPVSHRSFPLALMALGLALVISIYWSGLSGGFVFDDYPNIVDNKGVQPANASLTSLLNAALSSPSSDFKRPLASLSFATNYLFTGLDPYWMKLTNLVIHLLNGWLLFLLARALIALTQKSSISNAPHAGIVAAVIACGWMLLPINLTSVLYVVQRMESIANLFVLIGMIGYVAGRKRMLGETRDSSRVSHGSNWSGFGICLISIALPTTIGLLAKETAAMLPLYTFLIEWIVLGFRRDWATQPFSLSKASALDKRVIALFLLVLATPFVIGLAWLLPQVLRPEDWMTRNFTMRTRLLSEARIVVDYIRWILLPTPDALSFYHDDFLVSKGFLQPWATAASILLLACLLGFAVWLRNRLPLTALGILLFLGCHVLTATILPLELVYEHRNYFASMGLMLAAIPPLVLPFLNKASFAPTFKLPRVTLLICLSLLWASETAMTASAWGNPLTLAETLASRAPNSQRAQYELGRTYIIYSHYDTSSPFTAMAYPALERAAALPDSSVLPEQALIFMNARMHRPIEDKWWDSLIAKLKARKSTVQDESSLAALTQCAREGNCDLPPERMMESYGAALSHPNPSGRLLAMYSDYAWNVLNDHALGIRMINLAVTTAPGEPVYRITQIRMLVASGHANEARLALKQLKALNIGGRLDSDLAGLQNLPSIRQVGDKIPQN